MGRRAAMVQHHPSKEMRMKARAKAIKNNSHSPRQSVLKKDAKVHNANNKSSPAAAHSAHRSKAASNSRAVLKPVKPFTSPQGRFSPAPKGSSDARSSEVVLRPVKPVRSSPRKSKRQLQKDAEEDVILLPAREDSEDEAAEDDIFSDSTHSEFEYNRTSSSSKAADKHKVKDTVFTEQNPATPVLSDGIWTGKSRVFPRPMVRTGRPLPVKLSHYGCAEADKGGESA